VDNLEIKSKKVGTKFEILKEIEEETKLWTLILN
jgi:hypothetical protein